MVSVCWVITIEGEKTYQEDRVFNQEGARRETVDAAL